MYPIFYLHSSLRIIFLFGIVRGLERRKRVCDDLHTMFGESENRLGVKLNGGYGHGSVLYGHYNIVAATGCHEQLLRHLISLAMQRMIPGNLELLRKTTQHVNLQTGVGAAGASPRVRLMTDGFPCMG